MTDEMDDTEMTDADTLHEDARLSELIAQFGPDYNRPPHIVPKDEIWARISAARRPVRPIYRRTGWQLLAASVAFLTFGIAIGHEWQSRTGTPSATVAQQPSVPARSAQATASTIGNSVTSGTSVATITPDAANTSTANTSAAKRAASQRELASAERPQGHTDASGASAGATQADGAAYQLATLRHFTNAEALMTTYASSTHDRKMDAQLAAWSRDLLSQTRLLLDSPAADDPARRKLLQDLELVLVQMTQLSPSTTPIDRDLIDGSVRKGDMITRLRTAVPAGGATHFNGV